MDQLTYNDILRYLRTGQLPEEPGNSQKDAWPAGWCVSSYKHNYVTFAGGLWEPKEASCILMGLATRD